MLNAALQEIAPQIAPYWLGGDSGRVKPLDDPA